MSFPLTDEQRAAVLATEPKIAVVAGAGTGKTRVLTERYVELVLKRGVDLRRILAVTFTNKAAREMKERIAKALRDAGEPKRAQQVEFAAVSTMHAFLGRILRERALDAGVDPRYRLADEIEAELMLDEAIDAAVDAAQDPALIDLAGGEQFVRQLYKSARATPNPLPTLEPVAFDEEEFGRRMGSLLDGLANCAAKGKTLEKIQALHAMRDGLMACEEEALAEFPVLIQRWSGDAKEYADEAKALKKELESLAHRERATAVGAAVVRLLVDLDARYTELKRDEGLLDFADIEHLGLKLLTSEAGKQVAAEYDHLLVDEYQDTSRIQQALLDALAEHCNRFGVGDEKQSIYRFRYADARIFVEMRQEATEYPLSESFRSRPEVVGFVNELFQGLFKGTGVEARDLRVEQEWDSKALSSIEVMAPEGRLIPHARRKAADALAARLRELVDQKTFRYGDCALLMPRMSALAIYERAFVDRGIPYVVVKGRGYYAAREVVDLANLLLLTEDPHDDYRAVGVLTSLLCGVPEQDLLHMDGDVPWMLRTPGDAIPRERRQRLRQFAERFERWREMAGRVQTGALVETILDETRFADLMLLENDGRRRHANLKKVLRQARATTLSPGEFARGLLEFREREVRESEAPVSSEDDDAVQIMTVHASKGLEFKCVAIAELSEAENRGGGAILQPSGRFGFTLRNDDGNSFVPPGMDGLKQWEKQQAIAEERRLWYVAMTRAEEHLILSWPRTPKKQNKALAHLLTGQDTDAPVQRPRATGLSRSVRASLRRAGALNADIPRDNEAADALLDRVAAYEPPPVDDSPYIAAVADLVEFDRCPRRYRLRRMLGIEIDDAPVYTGEGGDRADDDEHPRRLLGTVFHKIIAEIGPGAVPTADQVRAHFPEARDKDVEKIKQWSEWLAEQPIAQQLQGKRLVPEMDFLVRLGDLPLRGSIDLYTRDVPLLLDYKTSRKAKPQEYALQVAIYLGALRALDLPCPDVAHLVYVDAKQVHEVKPVALEELIATFRNAHRVAGQSGEAFTPTPGDACEYCDFRAACEAEGYEL